MARRQTMDEVGARIQRRLRETQVALTVGQPHRQLVPPDRCHRPGCGALMRAEPHRDHDLVVVRFVCWNGHEVYCPAGLVA